MATYIVKPNQNIFDVALHLYGSIEGLFDLLITNDWLNMTSELETGMRIEYHDDFVINSSIVGMFNDENIIPSNGSRHVYNKSTEQPLVIEVLVNADVLKVLIVLGGEGDMIVDWGDNTELETISLSHTNRKIEHCFDNVVDKRRIKIYGTFSLTYCDTTNLYGDLLLMRPQTIDEYISNSNGFTLKGLFLCEGTYKVDLRGCTISDLSPIGDMSLQELNLLQVQFTSQDVLDDYLEYIVNNYGNRRNCTVYLDTEPSERGLAAINKIINEESWNVPGEWKFIINDTIYEGIPLSLRLYTNTSLRLMANGNMRLNSNNHSPIK